MLYESCGRPKNVGGKSAVSHESPPLAPPVGCEPTEYYECYTAQTDPALVRIVDSWQTFPTHIKLSNAAMGVTSESTRWPCELREQRRGARPTQAFRPTIDQPMIRVDPR